ncbi:unnamed protein product [Schistosoma margrebowiei]|uniref:C3H1-type domain-containing protein n=1 Tax=Schistosoma margrebowiei TaxID=48269 RepID=A0AA84ZER4_9TREM|nr:unnamed protein product [Schistosoma margrebowiei]
MSNYLRNQICRYFNTKEGCWYGDNCRFLHIPNKKPPCKFDNLTIGCCYGENCHFSHDRTSFKSIDNNDHIHNNHYDSMELIKGLLKANLKLNEFTGTNNNNVIQSSILNKKQEKTIENSLDLIQDKKNTNLISNHDQPSNQNVSIYLQEDHNIQAESSNSSNIRNLVTTTNKTTYSESSLPCSASHDDDGDGDYSIKANSTLNYLCTNKHPINQTVKEDSQNSVTSTVVCDHLNDLSNEKNQLLCGSCSQVVVRRPNENDCTLLKNHYLEYFLDKEGDHVKYVKIRAELEYGQIFWCKTCILIFEKPWSLFQHMADKAKRCKIQKFERKESHFDWLDNVAGLMAGYDLGLFNATKLKVDLRNLLTDQHTIEEELETAAGTVAIMKWLNLFINPWRLQQREVMRKIEQLNRQILRRVNLSLKTGYSSYSRRAALPPARVSLSTTSCQTNETYCDTVDSLSSTPTSAVTVNDFSLCLKNNLPSETCNNGYSSESTCSGSVELDNCVALSKENIKEESDEWNKLSEDQLCCIEDKEYPLCKPLVEKQIETEISTAGVFEEVSPTTADIKSNITQDSKMELDRIVEIINSNNTNCADTMSLLNNSSASEYYRKESVCVPICRGEMSNNCTTVNPKHLKEPFRSQRFGRNSWAFASGHNSLYRSYHNDIRRNLNRIYHKINVTPNYGINNFDPLSFSASLDFNFNFTDDEIEELISQWTKHWCNKASDALAILRGDVDHLLDP